ncbi:hypothetical protein [Actinomadura welshii]|uniref:hypothetical protein n=1 Tax=Actinomadura welshii TaxID=3103817 RepID=UPI00190F8D5C|nr:hypothetical protein [Actinomadura madurae]
MRLTTVIPPGGTRVGVLDGDVVRLLDPGAALLDVVQGGQETLDDVARRVRSGDTVPVAEASFGPLPQPPTVRDFLTYEKHIDALAGGVPDEWYEELLFYFHHRLHDHERPVGARPAGAGVEQPMAPPSPMTRRPPSAHG